MILPVTRKVLEIVRGRGGGVQWGWDFLAEKDQLVSEWKKCALHLHEKQREET